MMLSTVSIFATGQTGDESMTVFAGNEEVIFNNISTEGQVYTIETQNELVDDLLVVEFTNDLYLPEQGYDRNLTVEKIVIDGRTIFTTDSNVFAAGVWDPSVGQIVDGSGIGPTLHSNGFFDFIIEEQPVDFVEFAGKFWDVVDNVGTSSTLSVSPADELIISGFDGPLAISTRVNIQAGSVNTLKFDGERIFNSASFTTDGQPWATVGINYYDFNGSYISQDRVDVNSATPVSVAQDFTTPSNAAFAYLWVWIDGFEPGVDVPLKLSNFSLAPIDVSSDTTPPTAEFSSFTFDANFDNEIGFGVLLSDDTLLDFSQVSPGIVTVTGPDGFNATPPIVTGAPGPTPNGEIFVFGLMKPDGSDFDSSDNGVYTVTLNENRLRDVAGNVAAGEVLGTITVEISDPAADTNAPVVRLLGANDVVAPPSGGRGADIQFAVEYTDDRPFEFNFNAIEVVGPNGYSGIGLGIAGGGAGTAERPYGFFEITYIPLPADGFWGSNDNGTYTIRLIDGAVVDAAGNATPGRELGTFEVAIPDVSVG